MARVNEREETFVLYPRPRWQGSNLRHPVLLVLEHRRNPSKHRCSAPELQRTACPK
jgi:hypothetical protein